MKPACADVRYLTVVVRVPVSRIQHLRTRFGERFLTRCFSARERALCLRRRRPEPGLAARWAVRAAVRAALQRLGHAGPVRVDEAWIENDALGAPVLQLSDALARRFAAAAVSLAHDGDSAVAALLVRTDGSGCVS